MSRPLATASLTITPQPAALASARAGPADGSSRFQVACTQANGATPPAVTSRARRMVAAWPGPLDDRPITTPSSRSRASSSSTARSSSTPLSRVAEWTWYRSRWSPSRSRLSPDLAGQGGQGVVLDLVDLGVHAPVADVGVAPLGADGDLGRVEPAGLAARRRGTPRPGRRSGPRPGSGPRRRRPRPGPRGSAAPAPRPRGRRRGRRRGRGRCRRAGRARPGRARPG